MPPPTQRDRPLFLLAILAVMAVAGVWRAIMAAKLPVISRDGVTFCWYARELAVQGPGYLRTPEAQQHPLFPSLILAVQHAARCLGAPDAPMTWQRSGQLVCWVAGLAVVGLCGAIAGRLVRRLELPLAYAPSVLLAMLLAAFLDLNVWLSSDVMSEQTHLALYLGAVWLLLGLDTWQAALACGLLSGLAFLARQEGFVPALAGLLLLATSIRRPAKHPVAARAIALVGGFLLCAVPYWATVGRFSTKKGISDLFEKEVALYAPALQTGDGAPYAVPAPTLARLKLIDLPWYGLLPHVLYKLFRAGRVIVPLLATGALVDLRRRLLRPPLVAVTACLAGHLMLASLLLQFKNYLDARHVLVATALLIPFAALLLGRVVSLAVDLRRRWLAVLIVAACLSPLVAYSLRVPNSKDAFLGRAADWLLANDPELASKRLLSAGSPRRIAFYTGMRWEMWDDQPVDYGALGRQLRSGAPGYFAIQVGTTPRDEQFEFAGNRELLTRLLEDPQVAPYLRLVHVEPGPDHSELRLFELVAPTAASQPTTGD